MIVSILCDTMRTMGKEMILMTVNSNDSNDDNARLDAPMKPALARLNRIILAGGTDDEVQLYDPLAGWIRIERAKYKLGDHVVLDCPKPSMDGPSSNDYNGHTGEIFVVDPTGTMEQHDEPSYDVIVAIDDDKIENDGIKKILFKHIPQSWLKPVDDDNGTIQD